MKRRIKESKNIFPCTVYMENQDYDEVYYYLDTPEYGLSWRYFDDVEQEDIENYKYIIKNTADLRKAIDDLEEDFIHGYGNSYFKLSENYMEDLLNRGKTLVRVKKEHKERVYIIRVKPAQNVELATVKESIEDNTETGVFVVTDFSDDSYKNPKVKRIKIADGVTSIKEDAFFNCKNLTEVIIPDSVTTIGDFAFANCEELKTIKIPKNVTSIGKGAFAGCLYTTSIIIPDSVTTIEDSTFSNCMRIETIKIPKNVTSIGEGAFLNCARLTSIIIPDSVTSIGKLAFADCNRLKTIKIPNSVTSIGDRAFFDCYDLESIKMPERATSIGCETFYSCLSLKSINIPKGVTAIENSTFFNCKNLTEVIIPDSVTSIENDAFENCKNLKTIHYAGTRDQWNAIEKAFDWIADTREIMIDYNYQESSTFDESSVELALAESFEKTIKNLQKEGLFENVSSFDLNFTGKGINIKLNEGTYEWGANFGHNIDDDIEDNEDADYYTARPDKLFKSEEAAIRACEKYCDANPSDYCEVLHYHADSGWQVSEAYDGFYC